MYFSIFEHCLLYSQVLAYVYGLYTLIYHTVLLLLFETIQLMSFCTIFIFIVSLLLEGPSLMLGESLYFELSNLLCSCIWDFLNLLGLFFFLGFVFFHTVCTFFPLPQRSFIIVFASVLPG